MSVNWSFFWVRTLWKQALLDTHPAAVTDCNSRVVWGYDIPSPSCPTILQWPRASSVSRFPIGRRRDRQHCESGQSDEVKQGISSTYSKRKREIHWPTAACKLWSISLSIWALHLWFHAGNGGHSMSEYAYTITLRWTRIWCTGRARSMGHWLNLGFSWVNSTYG